MIDFALVNCRQLVTLAGPARPRYGAEMRDLAVVEDGAMLVRDGSIAAVGTRRQIEALCSTATELVDAGGRVVLPGFVDAHTHPIFAGTRADEFERRLEGVTYAEIAAAGGGIRATVRRTREASEDELLDQARRYREWFLRGGTTTIEAKSGYGLTFEAEVKLLRVIRRLGEEGRLRTVATFLGAHEVPDEYQGRAADYVGMLAEEVLPALAEQNLAEYCDIFCEPAVFTDEQARKYLRKAIDWGFGTRVHADQFRADYGSLVAAEMGADTADHLEATTAAGIEALRVGHVIPVLLPASVYALGCGRYANARAMIEAGLPVVLATDFNPGTAPTTSMPLVLSLACTQMKMTPAEAITAATVNAAYSLAVGYEVGSLEPGKAADFVIHDCGDYRELAYFFGRDTAVACYLAGERVWPA
jgi:imidazolonepropionase